MVYKLLEFGNQLQQYAVVYLPTPIEMAGNNNKKNELRSTEVDRQWTAICSLIICLVLTGRRPGLARPPLRRPQHRRPNQRRHAGRPPVSLGSCSMRCRRSSHGSLALNGTWTPGKVGHRCQPPIERVGACPARAQEVRTCTARGRVGRRACPPRSRLVAATACL